MNLDTRFEMPVPARTRNDEDAPVDPLVSNGDNLIPHIFTSAKKMVREHSETMFSVLESARKTLWRTETHQSKVEKAIDTIFL
jgi:hypothetical protein